MVWYLYLAYFTAGALFANGVPHFVHGISGKRFQSPFASPPGVGESSPLVNVVWGMLNFLIGYLILYGVGSFEAGLTLDALLFGLGFALTAVTLAWYFGRVRAKSRKRPE
jgi:hypothetical protein